MTTNTAQPLVLLISMEHSTERRERATSALKRLGLNYEWVRAVNGNELSETELNEAYDGRNTPKFALKLTRGELGVYLSHLKCYHIIRERKLPHALIMEDDMVPDEKLMKVLTQIHRFPTDWNIVNLAPLITLKGADIAFRFDNLHHRQTLDDGIHISKFFPATHRAHLYLIKQHHAAKLETHLSPIRVPIDWMLFNLEYSCDFPYALYHYQHGIAQPYIYNIVGTSEIDAMGRVGGRPTRPALKRDLKYWAFFALGAVYRQIAKVMLRVALNMPWRNAGKSYYVDGRMIGHLYLTLMVWRSCDWRYLPLALVRAILPQRR